MSKNIAIWNRNSEEYKRLNALKALLEVIIMQNKFPIELSIQNTYFDIGQDWMWTNIIVYKNNSHDSYQLLYPANHEKVIWGDIYDILEVAQEIKDEWLKRYKED